MACSGCYAGLPAGGGATAGDGSAGGETDGATGGEETGGDTDADDADDAACVGMGLSASPMVRLSRGEYVRSVRDLFGVTVDPTLLSGDERLGPFAANVTTAVVSSTVLDYRTAAEVVAVEAGLEELLPCEAGDTSRDCASAFVDIVGRRVFRRPVTDGERSRLLGVYDVGAADLGFDYGIQLVIEALLQDPNFLYRVEVGEPDPDDPELMRLGDYEIAARLAYFVWGTTPDDALLDLAEAGGLRDASARIEQARAMLEDPRAREGVGRIYAQWFGATNVVGAVKDPTRFPTWNDALARAMEDEIATVSADLVLDEAAGVDTLLLSTRSRVTPELAAHYGVEVSGNPGGDGAYDVDLPAGERAGLLTRAGVMSRFAHTDQTAPVHRGKLVREWFLCEELTPPPDNVDDTVPPANDATTARERFEQHRNDPACAACHLGIDLIGFGFENYDAVGKFRANEAGAPVDASGEIWGWDDGTFDGPLELSALLAESEQVRQCAVRHHATLALGHVPDAEGVDACWMEMVQEHYDDADNALSELIVGIVARDAFASRLVADAPEEDEE